jgi:prepilin-type N-terminal cleavage/methylation domain-containing protein
VDVLPRLRLDSGFSALELLIVVAIVGSMAAIGLPLSSAIIDDIKSRGDAQGLSAAVAQTKLTSAAKYTHARLYMNRTANTYRIQTWNRVGTPGWVNASDETILSNRSQFGFGTVTAPPPNTVATLAQAPECLDDAGGVIVGTSCVIFNSRGVSVTAAGPPAVTQALFLQGNSGTFAIIVGAAGQLQVWKTTQAGASQWRQQ